MGDQRLAWALLAAVVVHVGVLWFAAMRADQNKLQDTLSRQSLELVLVTPQANPQPIAPATEIPSPEASMRDTEVPERKQSADTTQGLAAALPVQESVPEPKQELSAEHPLKLTRPDDWQAFAGPRKAVEGKTKAFRPDLFGGLKQREQQQQRSATLRQRQIAQHGLSAEAYNGLETAGSNHVKTEVGCFDLRAEVVGKPIGPSGDARRWWRTGCKGIRENPLLMAPIEYDALGRAVGVSGL